MPKIKDIFRPRCAEILLTNISSHNNTAFKLQKKFRYTYSHIIEIIDTMKYKGLLTKTKNGRSQLLELTIKGQQAKETILKFRSLTN